eukprot:m.188378 g.188378  ORF g.188378 m.188378 type:complete len:509 (+) comp17535_c3_seq8:93-1619(+)
MALFARLLPRATQPHSLLCLSLARSAATVSIPRTTEQASYRHLQRMLFAQLQPEDVAKFEAIMPGRVLTEASDVEAYNRDWMNKFRGASKIVLRPRSVEEVSQALQHCHARNLAVCPQGGNTGLVGGSVPVFDEIVLSMSLMNRIISLDETAGVLQCQAGCVLENVDKYLNERGYQMPLDLGAKGSCHIGGNIATNAGGVRLLRYGSLHGSVLGLEVVLADGTILNNMSSLRKDNTGYDLKQLFIGSEGTLGVITAASILTPPKPKAVNVAFIGCKTFDDVLRMFNIAKQGAGEILSAFEYLDDAAMTVSNKNLKTRNPLSTNAPFYVLIESHGSNAEHDQEKLFALLQTAMEKGVAVDAVIAQDPTQASAMWYLRESLAEAMKHDGYVYKYDVSLPQQTFHALVEAMRKRVGSLASACVGYGHVGDGNLHLNVTAPKASQELLGLIEPFIYEYTASVNGSISAEHGLGVMKPKFISYSKSATAVQLMKSIKGVLDPKGILNPYKTLP